MASLEAFARRISDAAKRLPTNVSAVAIQAATEGARVMIFSTPVLTGQARGGWQGGVDGKPFDPTNLDKSGAAAFAAIRTAFHNKKPGQELHITNNVPYILFLDMGSSAKAPQGMTPAGLFAIRSRIRNAKLNLL